MPATSQGREAKDRQGVCPLPHDSELRKAA